MITSARNTFFQNLKLMVVQTNQNNKGNKIDWTALMDETKKIKLNACNRFNYKPREDNTTMVEKVQTLPSVTFTRFEYIHNKCINSRNYFPEEQAEVLDSQRQAIMLLKCFVLGYIEASLKYCVKSLHWLLYETSLNLVDLLKKRIFIVLLFYYNKLTYFTFLYCFW